MKSFIFSGSLLLLCISSTLNAQYAVLQINDCYLNAKVVDYHKSDFFAHEQDLLCFLEKEVAPNIWTKVSVLERSSHSFIVKMDKRIQCRFRVSFLLNNSSNSLKTIVDNRKYRVPSSDAQIWISNIVEAPLFDYKCDDVPDTSLDVYPNPASQRLYISLDDMEMPITISLENATGQTILKQVFQQNTNVGHLDVENLPSGIYLLQSYDSNGNHNSSQKIIIL